jgi:hypothetical protein
MKYIWQSYSSLSVSGYFFAQQFPHILTAVAWDAYGFHNNRKGGGYHCHRGHKKIKTKL